MTFEEFNKLPIGTKIILNNNMVLEKKSFVRYSDGMVTELEFFEQGYSMIVGGLRGSLKMDDNIMKYIQIISIPKHPQILKEKIQKISQEIDSKSNEKLKLEYELETVLKEERETILKNLIPNEWYKIQHIRGSYTFVKFSEIRTNGTIDLTKHLTGYTNKHNFYSIVLSDIKTIEHIKGAKEVEETFLKMLGG